MKGGCDNAPERKGSVGAQDRQLWGAANGVGMLCLAQGSLPPPHAAASCEAITAPGELSVSEAGDKRRREDVTPGSLRRRERSSWKDAAELQQPVGSGAFVGVLLFTPWSEAPWPEK